jgi:hypothetical protein
MHANMLIIRYENVHIVLCSVELMMAEMMAMCFFDYVVATMMVKMMALMVVVIMMMR